jgi:xylan 1,4-beta-xylosidase
MDRIDIDRRSLLGGIAAASAFAASSSAATPAETIGLNVDLRHEAGPLDHIWSKCVGSDRAAITLREQWRKDVSRAHIEAGIEQVRFHGIFADELGVYAPSLMSPKKEPNWQNVDQVYDGLLDIGVRPFVELSFMPARLASAQSKFGFYNANTSLPNSMDDWAAFIRAFAMHLIQRYGAAEVRNWNFEVWNEPNLPFFFNGKQQQYFELYKTTAVALKQVDPTLKVGGPSTAQAAWVADFLAYCSQENAPVDFVTTHIYAGDKQLPIFGRADAYPQNDVIPAAIAQVRAQIDATRFKSVPLWISEWSSDSPAMIAHIIKSSLPHCQAMSQWVASGVYEELGVAPFILKEGDGGWSMIASRGIPRPAFNTYKLMHRLGHKKLSCSEGPLLATKRADGSTAVLVWNLARVGQPSGIPGSGSTRDVVGDPKRYAIRLAGVRPGALARISYVDQGRGSPLPAWRAMGSPQYPTREQIAQLKTAAELPKPAVQRVSVGSTITVELPPEGVALIEL